MDETQYYKNVYSKFWVNQTKKYGYSQYEQNLVHLIARSNPQRVFEVGIGTGWSIATALKEKEIKVDGCDIAESSVALARKALENDTGIWVGDVLEFDNDILYDVTYCVRASWCIPDFYATLNKMISMTKTGGYIIFDVMDQYSLCCLYCRLLEVKENYLRFLGITLEQRYGTHFVSIPKIKKFLKKNNLSYQRWGEREITQNKDKMNTPKVVFCCKKET